MPTQKSTKYKNCIQCDILYIPQTNYKRSKFCSLQCRQSCKRYHTEETKRIISKKRKEYLRKNIGNIYWKRNEKFKSKPCEYVKQFLRENNINFIEEWEPLNDRYFSIDIAFPDIKFGIEINGEQHYNRDGTLKKYYQERHDLIVNEGWKLIELHYKKAFNLDYIRNLVEFRMSETQPDYSEYEKIPKIKKIIDLECKNCNICFKVNLCEKDRLYCSQACSSQTKRKAKDRPSKEELKKMLWEMPTVQLAKKFGVSDKAIEKWAKAYNLEKPPRGYWEKLKAGKLLT